MQENETNNRPHLSLRVADRMRALPVRTSRSRRRVFSFDRRVPTTGKVMVRRSGSTRMTPVVKRTLAWSFLLDRNLGNPTFLPLRFPALESDQFLRATHRSAIPVEYTSFELASHHGAMVGFSALNRFRSAQRFHCTEAWDGSVFPASMSDFTWAS